ncbi:CBU_0592 family membrane protein [Algirhabdus cladophorae]|uniref:CBU_0592 family membrane protein n=1 Tax=Algirhabdus cladophorae TaxID=3377108 RepID=UPI003B84A155
MTQFTQNMIALNTLQIAGFVGFFIYIWIFAAVQFGAMNGNSAAYSLGNVLAASLVGLSLLEKFDLASALFIGSWILFGLCGLILRIRKPRIAANTNTSTHTH